jgi:hypothetical protein
MIMSKSREYIAITGVITRTAQDQDGLCTRILLFKHVIYCLPRPSHQCIAGDTMFIDRDSIEARYGSGTVEI